MSCPHADTTTVAFLYGEAPEEHALHVSGCSECEAVVVEHEQVVSALGSTLPALRVVARPARRRFPAVVAAGVVMAMAAAALLVVRVGTPPANEVPADVAPDGFDVAIEELDLELTSLELELL